jgi:hypothetical protein
MGACMSGVVSIPRPVTIVKQERVLARLRQESLELLFENQKLEDEINELTRQSLARESPGSMGSSGFTSDNPDTSAHALPASLNPMFLAGASGLTSIMNASGARAGGSSTDLVQS